MWRWIKCRLWGTVCVWRPVHTERYVREADGLYVNVQVPRIRCELITQRCETCGHIRSREVILGPCT